MKSDRGLFLYYVKKAVQTIVRMMNKRRPATINQALRFPILIVVPTPNHFSTNRDESSEL